MISEKVNNWVLTAISDTINTRNAIEVHVDEFVDLSGMNAKEIILASIELFRLSIQFFKAVSPPATLGLYLSVTLKNFKDQLHGSPSDFQTMCEELDKNSIPEIFIYQPLFFIVPPQVEIYRKPLFFNEFDTFDEMSFFYKEDRLIDAENIDLEFTRELNVIYDLKKL